MILLSLKVTNFRQYYGKQEVEFATGRKKVTVINGNNGAGKTNMFLAINWCLYGSEGITDNKGELINKKALAEEEMFPAEASVELRFSHPDLSGEDTTFIATRSTRDPETLRLAKVTRKGQELLPNPGLVLNTILPRNVRHYFLFDGEKIDEFAKPEHEAQVKEAVYGVLQLEVLDRAYTHLSAVGDEYERDLKKMDTSDRFQELLKHKEKIKEELHETQKKQEAAERELKGAHALIEELDVELSKQKDARTLHDRRKRLEEDRDVIQDDLDSIMQQIRDIGSSAYLLFGNKAVSKALDIINEKRVKGEIPAGIREQFIHDLMAKKSCICGRPLSEKGPEWQTLLSLLNTSLPTGIENLVIETGGLLQKLKARAEQCLTGLIKLKTDKASQEDRRARLEKELDEISQRLLGVGIQEIESLESKRRAAQKKSDDFLLEIGAQKQHCADLQKAMVEVDRQIEKADGLQGRAKATQKKLTLANEAAKAVNEVYEHFATEMRSRIESETQKNFTNLVWKESQFTKVELTDDYKLQVLDRWGTPARPELSAGERQLLSLSFITALSQASEGSAPIVMDTPFGRLDVIPREKICEHLPQLVDQLILFVTGTELQGRARDILKEHIGREYYLDWSKSTGCTTIMGAKQ